MRAADFYESNATSDSWNSVDKPRLNMKLLEQLALGTLQDHSDLDAAVGLARLVYDEYELYGTAGSALSREDSATLTRVLARLLKRMDIQDFSLPFRDFETFRTYWNQNDAYGSWQARRDILNTIFEPLHVELQRREEATLDWPLASGISPHPATGWPKVDEEIAEMRRHFNIARSQQDYSNIGNDCVAVLEALSAVVYDHNKHGAPGEPEPPVQNTKARFDRYINNEFTGSENAYVRKLARATIELAQAVKHRRETATRTEAGVSADAVILLANILRRLQE